MTEDDQDDMKLLAGTATNILIACVMGLAVAIFFLSSGPQPSRSCAAAIHASIPAPIVDLP